MAKITFKGQKATVQFTTGKEEYTIKRVKGLVTYSIYRADKSVLKGGLLDIKSAKEWLTEFVS